MSRIACESKRLSRNRDLNLHASLDVDNDLFDDFGWGIEVNESLVDAHLKHVPGLGSFTARCLASRDLCTLSACALLDVQVAFIALQFAQ